MTSSIRHKHRCNFSKSIRGEGGSRRKVLKVPLKSGADPGFLPGEGAKGMMTLYGMGMSDF